MPWLAKSLGARLLPLAICFLIYFQTRLCRRPAAPNKSSVGLRLAGEALEGFGMLRMALGGFGRLWKALEGMGRLWVAFGCFGMLWKVGSLALVQWMLWKVLEALGVFERYGRLSEDFRKL